MSEKSGDVEGSLKFDPHDAETRLREIEKRIGDSLDVVYLIDASREVKGSGTSAIDSYYTIPGHRHEDAKADLRSLIREVRELWIENNRLDCVADEVEAELRLARDVIIVYDRAIATGLPSGAEWKLLDKTRAAYHAAYPATEKEL